MDRRKKGERMKSGERKTILKVFEYLKRNHPKRSQSFVVNELCKATGISRRSFYIIKKENEKGEITTPKKTRATGLKCRTIRKVKYDDFVRSAIRRKFHAFLFKNVPATIECVMKDVNDDKDLPNFKYTTFYRLLKEMGFEFEKRGKRLYL